MREIVHIQTGQCGNQIGSKVTCFCAFIFSSLIAIKYELLLTRTDYERVRTGRELNFASTEVYFGVHPGPSTLSYLNAELLGPVEA